MQRLVCWCVCGLLAGMVSCRRAGDAAAAGKEAEEQLPDVPLLVVHEGDDWQYRVMAELAKPDGTMDRRESTRGRRYLGRREPVPGKGSVDVFEVSEEGRKVELEFVEIKPDVILMRGSQSVREPQGPPMLLDKGVPLVRAGLRGGEDLPVMSLGAAGADAGAPKVTRKLRVIGRERVEVPAGSYDVIKILMTGQEGSAEQGVVELRRTIWFAPGEGIVREDKERIVQGKLLVTEQHLLLSVSRAGK